LVFKTYELCIWFGFDETEAGGVFLTKSSSNFLLVKLGVVDPTLEVDGFPVNKQ